MKYQKVTCIINPSSGKDTPILADINNAVQKSNQRWTINITQEPGDITKYTRKALENQSDLIIVYGGDGSVMEAARVLNTTQVPLLVIPGGTANVISKELGLPQVVSDVFNLLFNDQLYIKDIDMGLLNTTPFLLRVNFGIFADMITHTPVAQKQNLGQLAYGLTAASQLKAATPKKYRIKLNSEEQSILAIGLMVTNMGSVGIGNLTLNDKIHHADGLLDLIVVETLDFTSMLNIAASTLTQAELQGNIKHFQTSELTITPESSETLICDDETVNPTECIFKTLPATLRVLVSTKSS